MIQNLVEVFCKKKSRKLSPNKLKRLLEEDARKSGIFLFVAILNDNSYLKLVKEWLHPDWTEAYNKLLRKIKKKIMAKEKFKEQKGLSSDFSPLTPKGEKNMVLFFKPEEDKNGNKTGKYLVKKIKIINSDKLNNY
jgi:hypothetical protein